MDTSPGLLPVEGTKALTGIGIITLISCLDRWSAKETAVFRGTLNAVINERCVLLLFCQILMQSLQ